MNLLVAVVLGATVQWGPKEVDGRPALIGSSPTWAATLHGATAHGVEAGIDALILNGTSWATVGTGTAHLDLPTEAFTVEAWVQIDAVQEWGGIVGALQDNGSFEQGWLLGFRKDRFCFALATTQFGDADGTLTYLTAPTPFTLRKWHHVAGTWNGDIQRLYVDGILVAQDSTQSGSVRTPAKAPLAFGAYLDDDERFPMKGLLGPVAIHDSAMDKGIAALAQHSPLQASTPLVELNLDGESMRRFESDQIPGENPLRILRLPWNTGPTQTLDADLLIRVHSTRTNGGLMSALSTQDGLPQGWTLELENGAPVLHVHRRGGTQTIRAAASIEPDQWAHVSVQAGDSFATITMDGEATLTGRSLLGPLAPASHRHVVLAGSTSDTSDGTLPADVRQVAIHAGVRGHDVRRTAHLSAMELLPPPPAVRAGPLVRTLGDGAWVVEWMAGDADEAWLAWAIDDVPFDRTRAQIDGAWRRVVLHPRAAGGTDDALLRIRVESRTPWGEWRRGPVHETALSLDLTGAGRGYVLYLEPKTDEPLERAVIGDVQVTIASADPKRVQHWRRAAQQRGLPANRLAVHRLSGNGLPYAPWLFNEVHAGALDTSHVDRAEVLRVVRPEGGRVHGLSGDPAEGFIAMGDGSWQRLEVPGAQWWSRQYATPGHTSCSDDDLVSGALNVLWWGRPGPRPMLDRGGRTPSPLASHGRLFVQGDHAIFCLDAYNGSPRWSMSMPYLRRANVPRDTSNMAVGPDGDLHLAVQDTRWILDGETGRVEQVLHTDTDNRDWGLVDPLDDGGHLCTHVPREAMYVGAEGEWYDSGGVESWRVAGDRLVRLDVNGDEVWSVAPEGWLLHSTIARDNEQVLFVEVPAVDLVTQGRLPQTALGTLSLVAVDLETGHEQWRRPLDVGHFDRMTFVVLADDVALVVGSSDRFHTLAFDAGSGKPMWAKNHSWARDHHGGPLQHPVVVGETVYVESCAYDLHSGNLLRTDVPQGRGCGTKTASNHLLAFRHHFHSFWDPLSNEWTQFTGTRGGCWLGLLPAGGMLLGPETSSGCSCTHAIQTSMAWIPAHLDATLREVVP